MPNDDAYGTVAGPFKRISAFSMDVPCYLVRFDKRGALVSREAVEHLIAAIAADTMTDVLIYSHGWNNDFEAATALYDQFLNGVSRMAAAHAVPERPFKPAFVGVIWPSIALSFGSEDGPAIAGDVGDDPPLAELVDALPEAVRGDAAKILSNNAVVLEDATRLAGWVTEAITDNTDAELVPGQPAATDILAAWTSKPASDAPNDAAVDGFTNWGTSPAPKDEPATAALADYLDPRWIVRVSTVLIMKDRAGVVGANGVAQLIARLLDETPARLSLFGHSYGAKVVMTALASLSRAEPRRQVDSVLLLQPAVSFLCFAEDTGAGHPGGYVQALSLVRQPVHATWSRRDMPLTKLFHLVARRALDLGEMQMANAPSRYAALGGYGANGCKAGTCLDLDLPAAGVGHVAVAPAVRVVSLNGSASISGHGDVNRAETFWAAASLLR